MLVKAASHGSRVFLIVGLGLGAFAIVLFAVIVGEWLLLRNASVFVDITSVGMTDLFGRRKVFPLAELGRIELGRREITPRRGQFRQTVVVPITRFVSESGAPLFEIRGGEFGRASLEQLADEAKVPVVGSWPESPYDTDESTTSPT